MEERDINELAEYFEYLDELRSSGVTNMFGAAPYLRGEFAMDLTEKQAREVLKQWMTTSDGDSSPLARAEKALTTA